MAIESDFRDLMRDTATVYRMSARSAYGEVAYDVTGTELRGHYRQSLRMVRTLTGEEKVSSASFHVYGDQLIDPTDKIVLPDGTTRLILSVERRYDDKGAHHEVIYFE